MRREGEIRRRHPKDPKKLKNPSTLVLHLHAGRGPGGVRERLQALHRLPRRSAPPSASVFYQVQSNAAEIEAMRSGRLHVGGFSTGPTAFAVNLAGAVPSG